MLTQLDFSLIALLALAGVALDWCLGEVPRWHPLVGFGAWAHWLEGRFNRGPWLRPCGIAAWLLAVAPPVALAVWMTSSTGVGVVAHAILLYFCLGLRSLRDHNLPIAEALKHGDLERARKLTSLIVSRDTMTAEAADLAKASTESLLENGNDAVFGTLFWFVVAGGPGAVLFRLANTLDAMWGYRTERFNRFGWSAARIDDVLNWVPARLTAFTYLILAKTFEDRRRAWCCWSLQAPSWPSPNAGPVMASGAGALGLALGGAAVYDGVIEHRPSLGLGRPAQAEDIVRAWRLVAHSCLAWLVVMAALGGAVWIKRGGYA
jgi:adenosylcobinamide-phosphate synthase